MKMKLQIGMIVLAGALAAVRVFGGVDPSDGFKVFKRDVVTGGFARTVFEFEGCEAWVVEPKTPAEGNPWVWCMEWPTAFQDRTGMKALLAAGYRWVTFNPAFSQWIKVPAGNQNDEMLAKRRRFQKHLVETCGFAGKCGLIGMSWGGFYTVRYASTYPECVNRVYLDAPSLDFSTSASFRKNWPNLQKFYPHVTADYVGANDPMQSIAPARAETIAKAGIPVLLIYGTADGVIPPEKNARVFAANFRRFGGQITEIPFAGRDHHPHGLDPAEQDTIVRFFRDGARELFNGRDFTGWYTYLKGRGRNVDPKGVFSVTNGVIRVTGEEWGALVTEEEFSDYRLDVEYRFTGTRFGDKAKKALDSGILFHSVGPDGAFYDTWLYSHEYNLITGASGDIWTVGDTNACPDMVVVGETGGTLTDTSMPEGPYRRHAIWKEGGKRIELRGNRRLCRFDIDPGWTDTPQAPLAVNERPTGEWNTATLVCRGETVTCIFNGKVVNKAVRVVPSRGKIQLQSEGCGVEFRRVTLTSLP